MIKFHLILFVFFTPIIAVADDKEIYFELLSLSNLKIPNINCDIVKNGYRVGDFLSEYLQLMAKNTQHINTSLSCDDSAGLNCTFGYGNKPKWFGSENWSSVLRFEYDFKSKKIDETTIRCIDIP